MGVSSFFKDLLSTQQPELKGSAINYYDLSIDSVSDISTIESGAIMRQAVDVAIDYIASLCSRAEIVTYRDGVITRGKDWYLWNVRPNKNQTKVDFWKDIVRKYIKQREVLIVPINEQLIIADSFNKDTRAIRPSIFSDVVRDDYILQGVYTTDTAIYVSAKNSSNYNALVNTLGVIIDENINTACEHYYNSDGEHGILYVDTPVGITDEELDSYSRKLNNSFDKYFKKRNSLAVLFNGMRYERVQAGTGKQNNHITDITTLTKEAYSKVAECLKVPPALLLGDVANISDNVIDDMILFAVSPIVDSVIQSANAIMYSVDEYISGNFMKANYVNCKYVDSVDCSSQLDKLMIDGIYTPNEVRAKFGESRIDEATGDKYILTKNYDYAEGGE